MALIRNERTRSSSDANKSHPARLGTSSLSSSDHFALMGASKLPNPVVLPPRSQSSR